MSPTGPGSGRERVITGWDIQFADVAPKPSATTLVRSIYFFDPDGILLEFAAWTRELPAGPFPKPAGEADRARYLAVQSAAPAGGLGMRPRLTRALPTNGLATSTRRDAAARSARGRWRP